MRVRRIACGDLETKKPPRKGESQMISSVLQAKSLLKDKFGSLYMSLMGTQEATSVIFREASHAIMVHQHMSLVLSNLNISSRTRQP